MLSKLRKSCLEVCLLREETVCRRQHWSSPSSQASLWSTGKSSGKTPISRWRISDILISGSALRNLDKTHIPSAGYLGYLFGSLDIPALLICSPLTRGASIYLGLCVYVHPEKRPNWTTVEYLEGNGLKFY